MKPILRAFKIARIASSYGLDEWLHDARLKPAIRVLKWIAPASDLYIGLTRGKRLRLALQQLGIASEIVNLAFGILLGTIGVAAALAFGLGSREIAGKQTEEWLNKMKK